MAKAENENRRDPIHLVWMVKNSPNGSLDTGFGDGGGVTAGLTVATTDPCGLAIGSDGSIVAACTVQTGTSDYAFGVVRLAGDGTLDTSFNQSGEVTDDWGDHANHATSVAIESDGSILVGGYDASVSGDNVDLVRFLPDGSVDPNFLYGQLANEPIAGVAYSLAIQPNNMILVGGAFAEAVGERMDFGVARLMDSGAVDQNFGVSGVSAQNLGSGSQSAVTAVAVRPDGEILAAGVVGDLPTGAPTAAAVDLYFGGEADGAIVRVDDDHAVDTNNPTPALATSGDATVPANTPYTLTLGDGMADLGSGSNISYVVNWGDGNIDPAVSADDLAAQDDQVTHTYATAATDPITVDLDVAGDLNSPYLVGSESQLVTVDFSDVTTTSLDSITSPVGFGSSVALTATVTPTVSATGTPGGTVEFYDGTIDLGPGTLALNGSYDQATLNTPPLTFGTHSFTAIYGGDGTFDQSTSTPATASVGSSVHGPLTITASEVEGAEYALALPPSAGGEGITQWTIYWGDGTFTSINSTTQTQAQMLTQTHTFANGSYTITAVAASSAGNFSASTTLTVDLANAVAQGLTVATSAANYSGYDTLDGGSGAGVEISGSFSDPGALESHTVTIQWGDGSDPVSLQLDPGETTFDYPAPQYGSSGTYTISVSVADDAGATSPSTVVVNYSNVAPSALALNLDQSTIYADGQVNLSGSFTDLQANIAHTITIDWGDVSASPRDITSLWLAAGETTFQADPHTYSATGNDSISVTVCGIDGSTTATTPVKVNSTTTTVVSSPTSPTYGQSVTFTATVASVVSGNGAPTGTVDFYDQTTGVDLGTATLQSNGTAALSISDLAVGGHAIVATYSGDDNFPTSQSASASVSVTGQTLSLTNVTVDSTVAKGGIATLSGNVANLDGAGFTLVVSWGANQGAADSITYPPGTTTFSITHHYVDAAGAAFAGTYAIAIQVTSSDGRTTAANKTISGHDAPVATVNIAGGPTSIQGGGQEVSVSAVVADPGENGSFTYSWSATDGNDTPQTGSSPTFNFNAASPASYSVSLTVTDADGNTASASVTIPYGGSSGCCGGSITPFQPDSPTVTIEECDAEGRPYSSAVPAGSSAYFQVSVGASNMPAHGDVNVFYNTQDGNAQGGGCPGGVAQADTDYTSTAGELTFTYATAYAPQIIEVDTSPTSSGGTFSMVLPCVYDSDASIPDGPTSTASPSAIGTIEGDVATLDVASMSVVAGANGFTNTAGAVLSRQQKHSGGAWVPVNTENNAYRFTPTPKGAIVEGQDRSAPARSFTANFVDDALLPIYINITTSGVAGVQYSLTIPADLRVFSTQYQTGAVNSGNWLPPLGAHTTYWVEGYSASASPEQIQLNSKNGTHVANDIDFVLINTFTWSGPQDVPNGAIYSYTARGGDATNSGWLAPAIGGQLHGAPAQTMTAPDSNNADPNKVSTTSILWNSATPVVACARYQASSNYVWGYDVNEVAVNIVNGGSNFVAAINVPKTQTTPQNESRMSASLLISIVGPRVKGVQRGVRFIQAGFIQQCHILTEMATYTSAAGGQQFATQLVNLGPNGTNVPLQGQTVLDTVSLSTPPWYDSNQNNAALFDGRKQKPNNRGQFLLATSDHPFGNFQDTNLNRGNVSYRCSAITLKWDYTLQFAVRTTETAGNGYGVYTQRAVAHWGFNGNALKSNLVRNFTTPDGNTTQFATVADGTAVPIITGAGPNHNEVMNNLLSVPWSFPQGQ